MPCDSVIDAKRHLVVTTATGDLTDDEVSACCSQLKGRADFNPSFNQLLDLTGANRCEASTGHLQRVAAQPLFSSASRRAIVAPNPAIFGLARMFEAYRSISDVGEHVMVFRELREALAWLNEQ